MKRYTGLLSCLLAPWLWSALSAALPPVPYPAENPPSEAKRLLGKVLFWDEQLSSDNTVACGTCHRPAAGGSDPREGIHPGTDFGTIDDVHGSPGIAYLDVMGQPVEHPKFGLKPQVTPRSSPSIYGALWADEVFWDGRANGRFVDPLTGAVEIATGGALESQALIALLSNTEMSKAGRSWPELSAKLKRVAPLALATDWPADIAAALAGGRKYAALFNAAFGDSEITPARIAFALADYERTLIADQTPWDRYEAGDKDAMNAAQVYGWRAMQDFHCVSCHTPPLFTNNEFLNIGLRRAIFDAGRQSVSGAAEDAGDVKVPSLRNVGLRKRFMHTGEFTALGAAIGFYRTGQPTPERDDIPGVGIYAFNMGTLTDADVDSFLSTALTDPRVRDETYPFDRPTLRSERHIDDFTPPSSPSNLRAERVGTLVQLHWQHASDNNEVVDYILQRDGEPRIFVSGTHYSEQLDGASASTRYELVARDAAGNESPALEIDVAAKLIE
jgi:cytochrome c peroxidase